jgi:hypothetical protein
MAIGDVLKNFRQSGYGEKDSTDEESGEPSSSRILKLTDDEIKTIGETEPGTEVTCEVSGKLEDGSLRVMSVRGSGGGMEKDMASKVAGQVPPMMQAQTLPSPS